MITKEERDSIVNEAMEKVFIKIPDLIGNLMIRHAELIKINKEFYETNPDFAKHKDIVAKILGTVEGNNTLDTYQDIIAKATPMIKEKIGLIKNMSLDKVQDNPDINFKNDKSLDHKSYITDDVNGLI